MSSSSINIQLSHDEALVLLDFFGRFESGGEFRLGHNAEFLAFANVSAQFDKPLVKPFQKACAHQFKVARQRPAGGYEGKAPEVEPMKSWTHLVEFG